MPGAREPAFAAMFQPMAFSSCRPCLKRSCKCCFWVPTSRGAAAISKAAGQKHGPGIGNAVRLELLDLLDDAQRQDAQRDLGVDRQLSLELAPLAAWRGSFPRIGG